MGLDLLAPFIGIHCAKKIEHSGFLDLDLRNAPLCSFGELCFCTVLYLLVW